MSQQQADPVALVTGAASGIGRATADLLEARGYRLVLADRDESALAGRSGPTTVTLAADVSSETDNQTAVDAARDAFGRLDAVVLNAGMSPVSGPIDRVGMDSFDECIAVNLRSVVLGIRACAPLLRHSGGGAIVATASVTGLGGEAGRWHYAAAKAGVINLVRSAAIDLAPDRIRVNAVCPGPTRTGMTTRIVVEDQARYESLRRMLPLQRWADAEEIAEPIGFLLSRAASFITGVALPVDGGASAGSGQKTPIQAPDSERPALVGSGVWQ